MPNTKSAMKRLRTSQKSALQNRAAKHEAATRGKAVEEAVASGNRDDAITALSRYASALDKAVKRKIIPGPTAARRKSRAAKRITTIAS